MGPSFLRRAQAHRGTSPSPQAEKWPVYARILQRKSLSCTSHEKRLTTQHVATQASVHLHGHPRAPQYTEHRHSLCTSDTLSPSGCRLRPFVSSWCTLTQDRPVAKQWEGLFNLVWSQGSEVCMQRLETKRLQEKQNTILLAILPSH